jgi:diphthamide synthase (EF-2-diphthine--ammonia ligase)
VDTAELARETLEVGIEAWVTCVDPSQLAPSFAGRRYDRAFIDDLPSGVDACGENGEFHTIVTAGPNFRHSIAVTPGEVVERDGFVFADFIPT